MEDTNVNKHKIQKEIQNKSDKPKTELQSEAMNTKTWKDYYYEILKAIAIFK